jgi:hypothetical protein
MRLPALLNKLAWPALLFLLCVLFYWKLVLTDEYTWLDDPDVSYLALPRMQFQAGEWHHMRFPLWDPHSWFGQPFLGQFTGAAFPLNWPLFLLGFDQGKIRQVNLHWYYVLIHFLGALCCYWLCRDLRRSRPAALLGGLVFGLGGFLAHATFPELLNGTVLAPLVVLFQWRAFRGRAPLASAAASGLFLGLCWLSGHHEVPLYLTAAAAAVWVVHIVRRRPSPGARARLALVAATVTVLVSGLQTVPGWEYGRLALRWINLPNPVGWQQTVPYAVHQGLSSPPAAALGIVSPHLFPPLTPFIGLTASALALLGVATGWRRQAPVRLLAALAAAGFLYSLGGHNVFHGMIYALAPQFDKARVPARALAIFGLGVAPLAAYGLDSLRRKSARPWLRRFNAGLWGLGMGIAAVVFGAYYIRGFNAEEPIMLTGLAALLLASLWTAWRAGHAPAPLLHAALVFLVLFEIGGGTRTNLVSRYSPRQLGAYARLKQHDDIANFLKWQPQPVRVDVNDREIPYNFGVWHGIDTTGCYLAGVTANILDLATHAPRTQDLLAVNYAVDRQPRRPGQELVFRGRSGLNVYRNPGAFPRAWVVHEAVQAATAGKLRDAIDDPGWDLRAKAPMLAPPPALERCGGDEVRILDRKAGRVLLESKMNCRGLVVLADTAFPGWRVTVDGRPAAPLVPYAALRGVVVERGLHRLEWSYRPASAALGAAMTALGIAATGVLLLLRI